MIPKLEQPTKKFRVRMTWYPPLNAKAFKEIGEAVFYIANVSRKMSLNYADAEGLIFDIEVVNEDFETLLHGTVESFRYEFKHVEVLLEEVEGNA